MRTRSLAVLSATALSALLLAGCSGSADPTPSATNASATDLCSAIVASGDASESVTVDGEAGTESTATFETPIEISTEPQTTQVDEGSGAPASSGDYVKLALTAFDGATGEKVAAQGFSDDFSPQPITPEGGLGQLVGCPKPGSRYVSIIPGAADQSTAAQVYIIDVLDVIPADDWCAAAEPGDAFPTVVFDDAGVPTITIPAADPPTEVQLQVVEEGDGDVVEPGDTVTVDYTGVKWSDGTVFDTSYDGEPATFSTTGVVLGFKRALEGQTVGSTVLVTMPPACGYGEGEINAADLTGETLVFVVEILDVAKP